MATFSTRTAGDVRNPHIHRVAGVWLVQYPAWDSEGNRLAVVAVNWLIAHGYGPAITLRAW